MWQAFVAIASALVVLLVLSLVGRWLATQGWRTERGWLRGAGLLRRRRAL
jgi:hypothetical protein